MKFTTFASFALPSLIIMFISWIFGGIISLFITTIIIAILSYTCYYFSGRVILKWYNANKIGSIEGLAKNNSISSPDLYLFESNNSSIFALFFNKKVNILISTKAMDYYEEEMIKKFLSEQITLINNVNIPLYTSMMFLESLLTLMFTSTFWKSLILKNEENNSEIIAKIGAFNFGNTFQIQNEHEEYIDDIKAIFILSLCSLIFTLIPFLNETPLRVIFAIPMIFFIPGYAFITTIFSKRDDFTSTERVALSTGFSIMIVVFLGYILSNSFLRFQEVSFTVTLFLVTMVFLATSYIARNQHEHKKQYKFSIQNFILLFHPKTLAEPKTQSIEIDQKVKVTKRRKNIKMQSRINNISTSALKPNMISKKIENALIIALIISIVIAGGLQIYAKLLQEDEDFTSLYILGQNGKAENYPEITSQTEPITVTVGIENHENEDVNYQLQMKFNEIILQNTNISVSEGDIWKDEFTFTPSQIWEGKAKLEFALLKSGEETAPYRSVNLWISYNNSKEYYQEIIDKEQEIKVLPKIGNSNMEKEEAWTFKSSDNKINGSYIDGEGIFSSKASSYNIPYERKMPYATDQFYAITQTIYSEEGGTFVLSAYMKDTFALELDNTAETQLKQILINNILAWEDGIGDNESWQHVQIPILLNKGNNEIALQIKQKASSSVYPVIIYWDNISIQGLSELSPYLLEDSTIEFELPKSTVLPLTNYTNTSDINVYWNGTDIGSGIDYYNIEYSTDRSNWITWLPKTRQNTGTFMGSDGNTYYFRVISRDKAGNWEQIHQVPDTNITVDTSSPKLQATINPNPSAGPTQITVQSNEKLQRLTCFVGPKDNDFTYNKKSIEMSSIDRLLWEGNYNAEINITHAVEITGIDLAYNSNYIVENLYVDTSLEKLSIFVPKDETNKDMKITVVPSVALKNDPSIHINRGSKRILLSGPIITNGNYIYNTKINDSLDDGIANIYVTAYTTDSERITESESFVLDRISPHIKNMYPAEGSVINAPTILISAAFSDERTSIDTTEMVLKVNEIDVTDEAEITSSSISYPYTALEDGIVSVSLKGLMDSAGNIAATKEWTYSVVL